LSRIQALTQELQGRLSYHQATGLVRLSSADMPTYFLARELTQARTALQYCFANQETHPVVFYNTLVQLACSLQLLLGAPTASDEPAGLAYNHRSPARGLGHVVDVIESCLARIPKKDADSVEFDKAPNREDVFLCSLEDQRLLGNEAFYLWVRADVTENELISRFKSSVRIASLEEISHLVTFDLPGVSAEVPSHSPETLPAPRDGCYFKINTSETLWSDVTDNRQMAIHVTQAELPGFVARLHVVKP